jgi:CAAX prenyl protease-like protein
MTQNPLDYEPIPHRPSRISDDMAYILPMGIFLFFIFAQGHLPGGVPLYYLLRTVGTAAALLLLWNRYTKIRWNALWLGAIVGIAGTFQWIGMQLWLQNHFPIFQPAPDVFNPQEHFQSRETFYAFVALRLSGAVLVVPVMEELFWRDYLWRQLLAPNNFKLAAVGEWSPMALLAVSGAFATVHGNWALTAVFWGLMVGLLLVYTKSLGACIVAHATTNLLLGLWVLKYHQWSFW